MMQQQSNNTSLGLNTISGVVFVVAGVVGRIQVFALVMSCVTIIVRKFFIFIP